MANPSASILVLSFFVYLLHCSYASLLKETLAKQADALEENNGIDVEVVSGKNNKETNEDQEKVNLEDESNVSISMETIHRPNVCEDVAKTGKIAVVHYTGWVNGKKFDSTIDSLKRYTPFEFLVGTGAVIKGFEQGLKDMCKGEKRKIVIPPELGYGSKGAGLIPGNATITYDVQLLDIREPPPQADVFGSMDDDGNKKLSRDEVGEYMKKQAQMHYGAPVDDEYWTSYNSQMVDNIFQQEDVNEDGTISHDEFSGPKLHHEEL